MVHGHHHHHQHTAPLSGSSNARLMRLASYASVGMAVALLVGKTVAWWVSDSLAMLSSLTDSLFDVITSLINMYALRYALKPADDDHRFGHTSIEDIAGLAQFAFINAAMLIVVLQSVERLSNPQPIAHEMIGIVVSTVAMLFTIVLVTFQTMVAKRTGSLIIASDRLHYAGDIAFNMGVLLALFISMYFNAPWADPAMAIIIAVVILWSTREIGIRAFNNLMDREMPDSDKAAIHEIINRFPQVQNVHKLKTRYSGTKPFIQMHVEIDGAMNFNTAHEITDQLERALLAVYPEADVIIHPDPVGAHAHGI